MEKLNELGLIKLVKEYDKLYKEYSWDSELTGKGIEFSKSLVEK